MNFYISAIDDNYKKVYLDELSLKNFPRFSSDSEIYLFHKLKAVRIFIRKFAKFFPTKVQVSFKICVER